MLCCAGCGVAAKVVDKAATISRAMSRLGRIIHVPAFRLRVSIRVDREQT